MPGIQLAGELAENVIEIGAVRYMRDELRVLNTNRVPVETVHVRVIEPVAQDAPGVGVLLGPFGARIDLHLEPLESDDSVACFLSRFRTDDRVVVAAASDELLAVRRKLI